MKKTISGLLMTGIFAVAGGDVVPVAETETFSEPVMEVSSPWKHKLTIYGWLPTFDGTFRYQLPDGSEEESDASLIDSLDAIFMGSYEAQKGHWSFLIDVIYLGLSGTESLGPDRIPTVIDQEFSGWLVSVYGGYNVVNTGNMTVDLIGGMRYFGLDLDASIDFPLLPPVSLSPSTDLYDAVVGVKGEIGITEKWFIPYLFDVGAGDSDLTWQAEASIGYHFSWGDILATYRYIHYEKDDLRLIRELDLYGPKVGVVFRF